MFHAILCNFPEVQWASTTTSMATAVWLIAIVLSAAGLCFSALPLVAIVTCSEMNRKPFYKLLANFAALEFVTLFVNIVIPFATLYLQETSMATCVLFWSPTVSLTYSCNLALFAVAMEKYIAVVHGLRYNTFLTSTALAIIIVTPWIVAIVGFLTLSALVTSIIEKDLIVNRCDPVHIPKLASLTISVMMLVINVISLMANTKVALVARRHARQINQQRKIAGQSENVQNLKGIVGIIEAIFVITFFILPRSILSLVDYFIVSIPSVVHQVSILMLVLSFVINGWIFGLYNTALKNQLKKLLCKKETKCRQDLPNLKLNGNRY